VAGFDGRHCVCLGVLARPSSWKRVNLSAFLSDSYSAKSSQKKKQKKSVHTFVFAQIVSTSKTWASFLLPNIIENLIHGRSGRRKQT